MEATTTSVDIIVMTESWIRNLGFHFNPFTYLEASNDPYLGDYIVGHQTFSIAWEEAPAIIMAPPGGGKTTMRIYVTRSCWVGKGGAHPFPVPYYLPLYLSSSDAPSLESHCEKLTQASAQSLLISLVYRPEGFLHLPFSIQKKVVSILRESLDGLLSRYLSILRATSDANCLPKRLDSSYILPDPPSSSNISNLCAVVESTLNEIDFSSSTSVGSVDRFKRLADLIVDDLGFRCLFVLADGVDAFVRSGTDPKVAISLIEKLFERADIWAKQSIYLKGFLPIDTENAIHDQLGEAASVFRIAKVSWTLDLLAEVVRKRVHTASGGQFGSLDAVSSPALRDIETNLVKVIEPLPREAIRIVQFVLAAYRDRDKSCLGQIEPEDIDTAVKQYQEERDIIMPHLISRKAY